MVGFFAKRFPTVWAAQAKERERDELGAFLRSVCALLEPSYNTDLLLLLCVRSVPNGLIKWQKTRECFLQLSQWKKGKSPKRLGEFLPTSDWFCFSSTFRFSSALNQQSWERLLYSSKGWYIKRISDAALQEQEWEKTQVKARRK